MWFPAVYRGLESGQVASSRWPPARLPGFTCACQGTILIFYMSSDVKKIGEH